LVIATAVALGASLFRDYKGGSVGATSRRQLVIFGRLIERMIFQVEGVPKRRDHLL